jgi:hypothetical protein
MDRREDPHEDSSVEDNLAALPFALVSCDEEVGKEET